MTEFGQMTHTNMTHKNLLHKSVHILSIRSAWNRRLRRGLQSLMLAEYQHWPISEQK